jgi:hypothetical protein
LTEALDKNGKKMTEELEKVTEQLEEMSIRMGIQGLTTTKAR